MDRNILSLDIYLSDFDIKKYIEKIQSFCQVSSISDKLRRNIEFAFEELVYNGIVAFLDHNAGFGFPVTVAVEHYGVSDEAVMNITYGGERYNPVYDGDELSALVAKRLFNSVKYDYTDKNTLTIAFN